MLHPQLDALLPWLNSDAPVDLGKVRAFVRSFAGTPKAGGLFWDDKAGWERWVQPQGDAWDVAPLAWPTPQVEKPDVAALMMHGPVVEAAALAPMREAPERVDWGHARYAMRAVLYPKLWPDLDLIPLRVCVGPEGGISGPLPSVLLFFAMRLPPGLVGLCPWCDRLFARNRARGQPRKSCSDACKEALYRHAKAPTVTVRQSTRC